MKIITQEQLLHELLNVKGAKPVSIIARTVPTMRKRDNPYYNPSKKEFTVKKLSYINGLCGFRYENSVNNQRIREDSEPDFESLPRTWGEHVVGTPLIEHNGKHYLELKCERAIQVEYRDDKDEPVDVELLKPYFPDRVEGARQDLEKPVVLRDYALSSITSIKLNGQAFVVKEH